jgi:hypothetical protein
LHGSIVAKNWDFDLPPCPPPEAGRGNSAPAKRNGTRPNRFLILTWGKADIMIRRES